MLDGFKRFILRGNVVDLAVGVVIGASFGSVVTSLVKGFITPLIAAIAKVPDFSSLSFTLNGSIFMYGEFVNALISFLIIASVVYFLIVVPLNALMSRMNRKKAPAEPTHKKCPECLSEIPIAAKRCAFCTSELGSDSQP